MSGKLTLNRILNNRKLMMVLSVILALIIWGLVNYGMGIPVSDSRTYRKTMNIRDAPRLSGTMDIYGQKEWSFNISIEGGRWRIATLSENDFNIEYQYNDVPSNSEGTYRVTVDITVNKDDSSFTIVDYSPKYVDVDFYQASIEKEVGVTLNADSFTMSGETGLAIDKTNWSFLTPVVRDQVTTVTGPKNYVEDIHHLEARPKTATTIDKSSSVEVELVAMRELPREDEDDEPQYEEISADKLHYVTFNQFPEGSTSSVWVPVIKYANNIPVRYVPASNVPSYLLSNGSFKEGIITANPSTLSIRGDPADVDAALESVGYLGVISIFNISPQNNKVTVPFSLPSGVEEVSGYTNVELSFHLDGFEERQFSLPLSTGPGGNVQVNNLPDGRGYQLVSQQINVKLVGSTESLDAITADELADLWLSVDLQNIGEQTGTDAHTAVVSVASKYQDVWVYWGADSNPYTITLTIT